MQIDGLGVPAAGDPPVHPAVTPLTVLTVIRAYRAGVNTHLCTEFRFERFSTKTRTQRAPHTLRLGDPNDAMSQRTLIFDLDGAVLDTMPARVRDRLRIGGHARCARAQMYVQVTIRQCSDSLARGPSGRCRSCAHCGRPFVGLFLFDCHQKDTHVRRLASDDMDLVLECKLSNLLSSSSERLSVAVVVMTALHDARRPDTRVGVSCEQARPRLPGCAAPAPAAGERWQ